jgi:two-component system OmpR family response regulator
LRILVVEDESTISDAVRGALTADGHAVDVVGDGNDALEWASTYPYELVVLDVVLPGLDGFAVCAALRERGFNAPVLMLTALDSVSDRVSGLDHGADDYLAKPFAMAELRARVRALGRRTADDRSPRIAVQDLELDPATLGVRRAGRQIRLTTREFALLELLARHPGRIFAQDRLIAALWDADYASESNIVEVYIRSLRRKIDDGRRDGLIETVRGSGYRLRATPLDTAPTPVAEPANVATNGHGSGPSQSGRD